MNVSANFAFLEKEFPHVAEGASFAEQYVYSDPRAACFHARHALERLVKRLYKIERSLKPPKDESLSGYLSDAAFRSLVPEVVWQKADYIRQMGNIAVHGKKAPPPDKALAVVHELAHVLYWAGRTYLRRGAETLKGKTFDESIVPKATTKTKPQSVEALEALRAKAETFETSIMEVESELEKLRAKLAAIKAENQAVSETHDWSEDETRKRLIDLALQRAGWTLDGKDDLEYELVGMPKNKKGRADYVLWGDDGKPLGVVEAKKTTVDAEVGQQQAKLYADCLEKMHGQRPIIFFTNGYRTVIWDDLAYPPREVAGFYKKDELAALIHRRTQRTKLGVASVNNTIVERYYQKRAIGSIATHFTKSHRKALLVMATGTGKTRTAIALVDLLQRAGWIKRALFLADRVSLVNQAVSAFKAHLPESSPVNLVTEKDKTGRVYVCTYPTMMGLIDETEGAQARFSVGHFDLVIIDEAHRSVYQKFGAIFRYFDALLVGLTATPREQVDKNTYSLFELETGDPTDAYELEQAVKDGFLVPPRVQQVDLKFPREGIDYDALSDEEKNQWESLDWGDNADDGGPPDKVSSAAVNNWLFNKDTVDKVLQHLMEHGHKVDGGDRLGKTIIFARNHKHAEFIEKRFNHHYPQYKGHFARVIDNEAKYPQSLIDDFSQKDKAPHIAISVDMLDTGIDVPEIVNLVFFKPVYSKIKFWQMIGRGTRLCPGLYGPDDDKRDFRVFDFCFNFEFFKENPEGLEADTALPLGSRLFRARLQLLGLVQATPALDSKGRLGKALANDLHDEVAAMNRNNFLVREHLKTVDKFRDRPAWNNLSPSSVQRLQDELSGLPSERKTDELESRMFDLTMLRTQLALAEGKVDVVAKHRARIIEIALLLEEKSAIPAVKAKLAYLAEIQEPTFWEGVTLAVLEDVRVRLRGLVPFLDKKKRKIVFTDFQDEIVGVHESVLVAMPRMTGAQYEKKLKSFLGDHRDHLVVHRLRTNQPLTKTDLKGLETMLIEIGGDDGKTLLSSLLARAEAPSLAHFVRSLVGMDRAAAQAAFSAFLSDKSLTSPQIRFVEMIIDQLTARGVMEPSALYESPFSSLHAGGPEALFVGKGNVIDGIFKQLAAVHSALAQVG